MKKIISKIKNIALPLTVFLLMGCEKEIPEPVADFRILDATAVNELDVNEIVAGESLFFENQGSGQYLTIWTGDKGATYSAEREKLEIKERESSYTLPDGEEIEYTSVQVQRPENQGEQVNIKTGQYSYTYEDAGTSGDTTYTVTWIATNVDVYGHSKSDLKQITIRVREVKTND